MQITFAEPLVTFQMKAIKLGKLLELIACKQTAATYYAYIRKSNLDLFLECAYARAFVYVPVCPCAWIAI